MPKVIQASQGVRHFIPTFNDINLHMTGVKIFSMLELSLAYYKLELHEERRYTPTFSTQLGLFHYKQLSYAAAEIVQNA